MMGVREAEKNKQTEIISSCRFLIYALKGDAEKRNGGHWGNHLLLPYFFSSVHVCFNI